MNHPTKSRRSIEPAHPSSQEIHRNTSHPIAAIVGLALSIGLTSCVESYDRHGYSHAGTYRPGYRVNALPGGYRSEMISGTTYYYHDGYYYRPTSGGYIVVDAPRQSRYYDDYGRRHQITSRNTRIDADAYNRHDQRYDRGDILTTLPGGHRVVNHRGATYYQVEDRFYRRENDIYVVTSRPY